MSINRIISSQGMGSSEPKGRKGINNYSSPIIQVTDNTFKREVLESDIPVLVYFWAPWCEPCKMLDPVVDQLAQQYVRQIKVVKVNTDENPNVTTQYGIRSLPTLMLFVGGQRVEMIVGAIPPPTLAEILEKYF